jgi:hypothetical protein
VSVALCIIYPIHNRGQGGPFGRITSWTRYSVPGSIL